MKPLQASSGDLIADRRADFAEMLHAAGDHAPAAELMADALVLAPGWVAGWLLLGEMQEAAGRLDQAALAWNKVLALEPADRLGATLRLALIGKARPPAAHPSAFVETLFDQYADTFETSLVEKLAYRVPALLSEAVQMQGGRMFGLALDLGCGTGLMGEMLRPFVKRLEGYDISASMLKKAEAKHLYDYLAKADLQDFSYAGPRADLITAADVFIYLGGLEIITAKVSGMLAENGLLAFSVEKLETPGDLALQVSRRYAHAQDYVRKVLGDNGLAVLSLEEKIIRQDRREPVMGLIVVAGHRPH
ncbi:methyltransferase [Mesorhizobium sp. Root157]|uniref:class I SAM-dependent DNA methyltransferase n=1 Tax=Mesorhizobium sp. Root157 TaxID=1736477 RepID=UPI0007004F0A|nr:methyltransferase domain-containing protein [Mesorhizobium sp. Root157]KQZ82826.1 methyltransferase [Mesorhizobium sp. Root157]